MESFTRVTGIAAPLLRNNIDTDQIIPTRFLARLSEDGLGEGLFAEWRALPDGTPDPAFPLHRAPWNRAEILVAGASFGCGSSREAAPRALRQNGFRAVVAPSFGDIFYGNCFRNGILPVRLPEEAVLRIGALLEAQPNDPVQGTLTVDLETNTVTIPATGEVLAFATPPVLRRMLLEGLDEIALTLRQAPAIAEHRAADRQRRPWAYA
jgi:3-isopropylmalate/(R)-2-methylmalate dehydratase small subunit